MATDLGKPLLWFGWLMVLACAPVLDVAASEPAKARTRTSAAPARPQFIMPVEPEGLDLAALEALEKGQKPPPRPPRPASHPPKGASKAAPLASANKSAPPQVTDFATKEHRKSVSNSVGLQAETPTEVLASNNSLRNEVKSWQQHHGASDDLKARRPGNSGRNDNLASGAVPTGNRNDRTTALKPEEREQLRQSIRNAHGNRTAQ